MPDVTFVCNVHKWRETWMMSDEEANNMEYLKNKNNCPGCERDRRLAKMIAEEIVRAQNAAKNV